MKEQEFKYRNLGLIDQSHVRTLLTEKEIVTMRSLIFINASLDFLATLVISPLSPLDIARMMLSTRHNGNHIDRVHFITKRNQSLPRLTSVSFTGDVFPIPGGEIASLLCIPPEEDTPSLVSVTLLRSTSDHFPLVWIRPRQERTGLMQSLRLRRDYSEEELLIPLDSCLRLKE